jgi:short-subunit dehydrogenase
MRSGLATRKKGPLHQNGSLGERIMISSSKLRPAVVVIGASGGIGRAIARVAALERGAVVLIARSPAGLNAAAAEVREAGGEPFTLELDLLARDAPALLEDFLSTRGLVCDVLVNSAGYGLRGAATALPIDDQLGIIDLNIRALTELTLHFLPAMVARGRGGVLNLSSVAGFVPGPYMALYYASKSFVRSFSEALYQELRRTGVTVTCVAPGPVSTEFYERAGAKHASLFSLLPKLDPEDVAKHAWRGFKSGRRLVVPGISAKLAVLAANFLPAAAMLPLIGRLQRSGNDPCPCGSGKKFKNCCGRRRIHLRRSP